MAGSASAWLAGLAAGSMLLHGALLAALIWRPGVVAAPATPRAEVEVQMVSQADTKRGAPDPVESATPPQPPTEPAQAAAPQPTPPPPSPAASAASQPVPPAPPLTPAPGPEPPPAQIAMPPPAPPAPAQPTPVQPAPATPNPYANVPMPTPRPAQPASAAPAVHLGNGEEDRDALTVTGDNVVSEGPDARYHNMPPHYPRDAARAHQHGAVSLIIHITPSGEAGEIEVVDSSGIASMDEAARLAVSRWRFKPPVRNGAPVRSVYLLRFDFVDSER